MAAYVRNWADVAYKPTCKVYMKDLPDSLDIAIVFSNYVPHGHAYWDTLKNVYIPHLHARGTKVIYTGRASLPNGFTHDEAGYKARAKEIVAFLEEYNMDGWDIDIEHNPTGQDLKDIIGIMKALSEYLGPKSGTDKLLTLDTNKNGTHSVFRGIYPYINYVFLQAYGRGAHTLQGTWNTYKNYIRPDQFVPGFSFYEENGHNWNDVHYPDDGTGRCYDYARWQPNEGRKGGIFSYAIGRDIPYKTNKSIVPTYHVTNALIKVMNPAGVTPNPNDDFNLALSGTAVQSSLDWGGTPGRAIDGNTNGNYWNHSVTHTRKGKSEPWWTLDLGQLANITEIKIYNRTDCCAERLRNYHVFVSDQPFTGTTINESQNQDQVLDLYNSGTAQRPTTLAVNRMGQYIRVQLKSNVKPLSLAEVEVIGQWVESDGNSLKNKSLINSSFEPQTAIQIAPNPVRQGETIKVRCQTKNSTPWRFYLTDLSGKTVMKYRAEANNNDFITLQLTGIMPGIYLLNGTCGNQRVVQKIIVK